MLKQIEMLENSRDGLKTIRTRGTLKYCHVGIKSHLSIRHTKGRIAQQYQFRRESWALRTEPICSRNKCREHQSVRGVRWCNWEQLAGRKFDSSILLLGHGWWYGFKSHPHIPKNCNLWKFVHLLSKVLRKAYSCVRVTSAESGAC